MRLLPRTLLLRTFLLIALLMSLSVLAWLWLFSTYEQEPRARHLSQLMASVVNLTRAAIVTAEPDRRAELLGELSEREGIRIYPAGPGDVVEPLPDNPLLQRIAERLRARLGPDTKLTLERDGESGVFISFSIDDDEYWVGLPRERIERAIPWQWLGWGAAALLLSLAGAWLVMFRVARPLQTLAAAASEIGRGRTPPGVAEDGPEEIRTLSRAFNQMSSDLARLDADRALILAGISHDLRTPLSRLRMGIELSSTDEATRSGMEADVEEMDRTIGQFLDFARLDGGEALRDTDIAGLIEELADHYARRGVALALSIGTRPITAVRPQAFRRALTNLIENALHHGAADAPVSIELNCAAQEIRIDIADRGPGIAPDHIERLKLPFTRLDASRSNVKGAGLGLAIVDRIARGHGGRLDLLPRDGGGLIARVVIPQPIGTRGPSP
jgi:two-component system osmolarity sensor histidine kinase EnvZ